MQDRHRFSSRFLRSLDQLGYRTCDILEETIGDTPVRTILLAQRLAAPDTPTAHAWLARVRPVRLPDGLVLYDLPARALPRLRQWLRAASHRLSHLARGPLGRTATVLVTVLTLVMAVERVHNASVTQQFSTGVTMVLDESLYEQGLELLPQVQHAYLPYYDDVVARLIIAKLGHKRATSVRIEGAALIGPPGTAGTDWVDSSVDRVHFERTTVSGLQLRGVRFGPRSNFTDSKLRDLRGSRVSLTGGLTSTQVQMSRFVDFYAYGLVVDGGGFSDVTFIGAPGTFNSATFRDVRFERVTFTHCDFQQASFEGDVPSVVEQV